MNLQRIFDPDQVEARNARRLARAGAAVVPVISRDAEGCRQWAAEIEIMRRGDCQDWFAWSRACRAGWAASMIEIGREFGVEDVSAMGWLDEIRRTEDAGGQGGEPRRGDVTGAGQTGW